MFESIQTKKVQAYHRRVDTEANREGSMIPIKTWPKWVYEAVHNRDKPRTERYKLFRFFWLNGVPPEVSGYFVNWWEGRLDAPDFRHLNDVKAMIADANQDQNSARYKRLLKGPYYDVHLRRVIS